MTPEAWRDRAGVAAQAGDLTGAREIYRQGLVAHPDSAALANSAANLEMKAGDASAAEALFARAGELEPGSLEFAVNRAIALNALGRHAHSQAILGALETAGQRDRRYCSTRAVAERGIGNLAAAATWFDRATALDPGNARALHGRSRVALERGEPDAVSRFERSLATNNRDPEAWLGLANALDAAGDAQRARQVAEQLVAQAPEWIDALFLLAQLRLAAGDHDYASHYAPGASANPAVAAAHAEVLAGLGHAGQAADVAATSAARFPREAGFVLREAIYCGEAGDDERAQTLFAALQDRSPVRLIHEARHRIRLGEMERAGALLDEAGQSNPWGMEVWALRGILWRLAGDDRAEWLHGQPGLAQLRTLPGSEQVLPAVLPLLHRLHDGSALPLGQSLRGGTQTRHVLFDRTEPELAALHAALLAALEEHRAGLPPHDPAHPLLRHRDEPWTITGSWSVRLAGGGGDHHTAHIHPQGILSSALYCELDGDFAPGEGVLELGRPAPDLRLDLGPLRSFSPEEGSLALFPSTLYHGTTPFSGGSRLTVAFDVSIRKNA